MTHEKCPTCGASTFGRAKCIVCNETFRRRHPNQITCGKLQCRKRRQLQKQNIWIKELRRHTAADRFLGESVVCLICGTKVKKTRSNQATCLTARCMTRHRGSAKFRGIKAVHVRD